MTDEKEMVSTEHYGIGFNDREGTVMVITIPLKKWAEDFQYGEILVNGTMELARVMALKNMAAMRKGKAQSGIISGKPSPGIVPFPPGVQ